MEEELRALQAGLAQAISSAHVSEAQDILDGFAARHSCHSALTQLLEPVLLRIGEQWEAGQPAILAQGYLAAKLTERLLLQSLEGTPAAMAPTAALSPVVLGNIEDDFHALGRKMVATFSRAAGWEVMDLGNDVPAEEFVRAAQRCHARVLGVSAMMYTTASHIRGLRQAIDAAGLKDRLQLAVGGAVFNLRADLVGEVGADGTARTAIAAPKLFESLARRSLESGPAP
jgi:methanogenic corrinoid protein MtbC1